MTDHIIKSWNAQADAMNKWDALGEDEKLAWAYQRGMERAAEICDGIDAEPFDRDRHDPDECAAAIQKATNGQE